MSHLLLCALPLHLSPAPPDNARPASDEAQCVSSSLLGPVVPSFRALSGRLKFMVRRHKFIKVGPKVARVDRAGAGGGAAPARAAHRASRLPPRTLPYAHAYGPTAVLGTLHGASPENSHTHRRCWRGCSTCTRSTSRTATSSSPTSSSPHAARYFR